MDYENKTPKENNKLSREAERVERMKLYVAQNLAANLHAIHVSGTFKLSISSFQHLFKKHEGRPYRQYLEDMRMQKAFAILQKEGIRIKEVMYETGYKNRSTFNNAFKKKFKHSPGHFKK